MQDTESEENRQHDADTVVAYDFLQINLTKKYLMFSLQI
jgi:hypothetical protein